MSLKSLLTVWNSGTSYVLANGHRGLRNSVLAGEVACLAYFQFFSSNAFGGLQYVFGVVVLLRIQQL